MEDDDFTIDNDGSLDLRYRGWTEIDNKVYSLAKDIISLDLSFNQIQSLPDEIGLLKTMKHFNCACNALNELPTSIGRLRRMNELKLNGNKLSTLPDQIGLCCRLSKLYLNENALVSLPHSIAECSSLTILHLQNNNLTFLPLKMSTSKGTLVEINLENNPDLSIIPSKMQANSAVIMWIICLLHKNKVTVESIRNSTLEMSILAQKNQEQISEGHNRILKLEEEKQKLIHERESVMYYIMVRERYRAISKKMQNLSSFCKSMLVRDGREVGIYESRVDTQFNI